MRSESPSTLSGQQEEEGRYQTNLHQPEQAAVVDAAEMVYDRLSVVDHGGAETAPKIDAGKACRRLPCTQSSANEGETSPRGDALGKAGPARGHRQGQAAGIKRNAGMEDQGINALLALEELSLPTKPLEKAVELMASG